MRRPGALAALIGGAGGGLVAAVLALSNKDPISRCTSPHDAIGAPLNLAFVVFCAGSFLAGGILSDFARGRDDIEDARGPEQSGARTLLQGTLVGALAILSLLLTYETWSLVLLASNPQSSLWPITWFVRCISTITTLATIGSLIVVCIMCGFFGKWLWYRPRTYRPRNSRP